MNTEREIFLLIKSLVAVLEGKKEEKKEVLEKLEKILKQRKKEYLLPQLFQRLERNYLKKKKIELVFAREHSKELIDKITAKLRAKFGEDKEIIVKIDKSILGGFRVKTSDFLIKSSIKDFLKTLKTNYGGVR
jgi:F-type H+-transporting ATPase subunit delta